eukprot:3855882-Lingulodinium_polyedra.AAC.1
MVRLSCPPYRPWPVPPLAADRRPPRPPEGSQPLPALPAVRRQHATRGPLREGRGHRSRRRPPVSRQASPGR